MATRDRTALFIRFREEARSSPLFLQRNSGAALARGGADGGGKRNGAAEDGVVLDMDELGGVDDNDDDDDNASLGVSTEFHRVHERLNTSIALVEQTIPRLADLQAKRLLPGFEEESVEQQERDIRSLTDDITRMLHSCEVQVRAINAAEKDVVWANMQRTFASRVQEVTTYFRRQQKTYMKNLQNQRDMINSALIRKDQGELLLLEDDPEHTGGGFTQDQLLEVQAVDFHMDERSREIDDIAQSIGDLSTVMKDMAALVVEQGTVLDRVDFNIQESQFRTGQAAKHLKQAERYQRRGVAFSIIMCLMVGCAIMMIVLLLKLLS